MKKQTISVSRSSLIWGVIGTVLNIAMGILVLPIILVTMSEEDIAIWYVFAAIQSLIALLDFGFSPTFTRNVTYAFSGAKDIVQSSFTATEQKGEPNLKLLYAIYRLGRKIYMILSMFVIVILSTVGLLYFRSVLPSQADYYYISFAIFSLAMLINIFFSYIPAYMKGIGAVKESYQAYVISRVLYIAVACIMLFLNLSLIAMTSALLLSGLALRIASVVLLKKHNKKLEIILEKSDEYDQRKLFSALWFNTKREGIILLANFLIQQSATFISTSYLGLAVSAQYGLTIQLLNIISTLSFVYFSVVSPRITQARVNGEQEITKKYFCNSESFLLLVFIVGCFLMICFGDWALNLIGSNSQLLSVPLLIAFSIVFFLEKNHTVCASFISTSNQLPYTMPYFISSIIIFALYWILILFTNCGVWSFVVAQGIVQLCYNNWKWPHYVRKELNLRIPQIYIQGTKGLWQEMFLPKNR